MSLTGPEDRTHHGTVKKALIAFWSQKRAHHGDKVKISVRGENLGVDAKIDIRILAEKRNVEIDKLEGLTLPVKGLDHEYPIEWKDKPILPDDRDFVLEVLLPEEQGTLRSPRSAPLWVDLQPPLFSV